MTVIEVKKLLLDKGLTISEMARDLAQDMDAKSESIRTMLTDLLYGHAWHPTLAMRVKDKYDITIKRPKSQTTIREAIKQAA